MFCNNRKREYRKEKIESRVYWFYGSNCIVNFNNLKEFYRVTTSVVMAA